MIIKEDKLKKCFSREWLYCTQIVSAWGKNIYNKITAAVCFQKFPLMSQGRFSLLNSLISRLLFASVGLISVWFSRSNRARRARSSVPALTHCVGSVMSLSGQVSPGKQSCKNGVGGSCAWWSLHFLQPMQAVLQRFSPVCQPSKMIMAKLLSGNFFSLASSWKKWVLSKPKRADTCANS